MRTDTDKLKWLKRLLLMALLAPFTLLWGEAFTRVLLPQNVDSTMNIFTQDPEVGYIYKPNSMTYEKGREYNALYRINSVGLRDREYGKKGDVFRILLLGDSFAASHGLPLEDSLSRQLERELQKDSDLHGLSEKIEVINAASGGYSPYNYWKAYRRWAPLLKPDAVLVALSPDDYDCSNEESQYVIENGVILAVVKKGEKPAGKQGGASLTNARKWLSRNSEFYILMRNFFYYNELAGRVSLWMNAGGQAQAGQLQQYRVPEPESIKEAWDKSFTYVRALRQEAAADRVPLIVLSIPAKIEIDQKEYDRVLASSRLKQNEINPLQPRDVISAFCKREAIPFLDPRKALRDEHGAVSCYFSYDDHWNARGIGVAAASMAAQWRDLRLPPWPTLWQKKGAVREVRFNPQLWNRPAHPGDKRRTLR